MTDPLRPFADAIRTLWRRSANVRKRGDGTNIDSAGVVAGTAARKRSNRTGESLRARLCTRMAGLDAAPPQKLREAFVETVLLWELGEQLTPDPAFADLVVRVSEQLVSDPQLGERLHRLLLEIGAPSQASRD